MCPISSGTRSDSDCDIEGEDRSAESAGARYPAADVNDTNLIRIANKKCSLITVLLRYKLKVVRANQSGDWSEAITCPMPFHHGGNERTPSFGYNYKDDFFYCLGCKSHGGAVEFISYKEGLDRSIVAEQIIKDCGGYDVADFDEVQDVSALIEDILFEFSSLVSGLVQKHKHNPRIIAQIDKILWWVDKYLVLKVPANKVVVDTLEDRILRAKELLEDIDYE